METTPSEQYLKELLDTLDGLENEEIAGALTQAGFIEMLHKTPTIYGGDV